MASTSSASSIQKSFKYDVFMSFRGEDTRKRFVDHLYHALQERGINTYKDDEEIKKGKTIGDELIKSIEDSQFYIIVFSKNYASSSWCLDELVKIMECHKTNEHTAYPLFYDVEPTEVRNQSGAVEEAFVKHKDKEGSGRWRDALTQAADLAGWELKTTLDGHEAKFIRKIVEEISLELRFIDLSVDGKLVGMETRVGDVVKSLEIDIDDSRIIGIKGIGGGGKTTLARVVFDQIFVRFEGSSFVENVRETSKNPLFGLKSLQKQVLSDIFKKEINVTGVYEGKKMMKKMICDRKVLVVLDDVDHINQLEALAGELNWFKPGSRVIITTREEQVLIAHGVPKNLILDVTLLSQEEAICLFNKYAFGGVIPNQGYDMLSKQVVCYAAGLPLSIKVLGSLLRGKDELEWKDALERLKSIPLQETLEILELSYESLEEEYKEIFLDVSCMLKGWDKEEAIRALECRGFHARIGLKVLELKSLITVSEIDGCLGLHDHIEEMGKNIVRRLHPNEPCRHSRLWIEEEIKDIFVEDKGTEEIKCIEVWNVNPLIVMKGLRKMKDLRFLDVICEIPDGYTYNDSDEDNLYLPNSLQYLRWVDYPFTCLPKIFQANNLVGFEMHYANNDQLWEGEERKVLNKLRFISLFVCKLRTLDLTMSQNLEMLHIRDCEDLVELCMPIESPKLKSISIHTSKLRNLNLTECWNLEVLVLEKCKDLVEFHMPIESINLKTIDFCLSKLRTLDLTVSQNLEMLHISQCEDLVKLCMPIESPKLKSIRIHTSKLRILNLTRCWNLEVLVLEECGDLVELHMPIESIALKSIKLFCSKLTTLMLTGSQNLKKLHLGQCEHLVELHMPIESPNLETIIIPYSKVRSLNVTGSRNLELLHLGQCEDLEELDMPIESPKIKSIHISLSKLRILDLSGSWNLKELDLGQCKHLVELHMPIESPNLETIIIPHSKVKTLNLTGSRNLELLHLGKCEDLEELDMPIESLKIKSIHISLSKLRILNLTGSRNLKELDLGQCEHLVELHMPDVSPQLESVNVHCFKLRKFNLTGYRNLERLDLKQCEDLVEIDMPIKSPNLKAISIPRSKLRTLDLTRFQNLEWLDVKQCEDLVELHMPIESPKLKSIHISLSKLRTLDLTGSRNLEMLYISRCEALIELCMPIESPKLKSIRIHASNLRNVNLTDCWNLESLDLERCEDLVVHHNLIKSPYLKAIKLRCSKLRTFDLTGFRYLERLDLKQCEDLVELHMPIESPTLKTIYISVSKLRTLDFTGFQNLEWLDLRKCEDLVELHMPIENLKLKSIKICCSKLTTLKLIGYGNLEELYLEQCQDLVELHIPIKSLKLKSIKICCSKLTTLNLTGFLNLEELNLEQCVNLIKLHMPTESAQLKSIIIRNCSKLRTLHLGLSSSLEHFDLHDCFNLVEIYAPVGCLSGFVRFKPFLTNEGLPMVGSFDDLHLIAKSVGICSLHPKNNLPKFHFECIYKELLLSSTRNLAELITNFGVCACTNLVSLPEIIYGLQHLRRLTLEGSIPEVPKELDQLECLEELTLLSTSIEHLPDSICMLKHLKVLQLKSCWLLKQLPEDLGRLECLEELCLTDCISIRDIPNSICEMKLLKCFHLTDCILVERLPKGIGRLKCLKELNIRGTGISDIPESIFEIEDLRFIL